MTPNLLPRVSRRAILFLLAGLLSPSLARAFEQRNLYAHGSPGNAPSDAEAWLVYVESRSGKTDTSIVLMRDRSAANDWKAMPSVPARVFGVATQDGELVMVLHPPIGLPRDWVWYSTRYSYGPQFPQELETLAIAGDRRSLWIFGRSSAPATQPTTAPSTAPSTQPVGPILYRLTKSQWEPQPAAWPADIDVTAQTPLSLALFNEKPTLAILAADGRVQLLQLENDAWALLDRLPVEGAPHHLKLLSIDQQPGIWYQAGDDAAGSIVTSHRSFKLAIGGPAPKPADIDVVVSGSQICAYWRYEVKNEMHLVEQRFLYDGKAQDAQPVELKVTGQRSEWHVQWMVIAAVGLALVLIVNAFLKRRQASRDQEDDEDEGDDE